MPRCQGITKSGSRCKRTVPEGEDFCQMHSDQATASNPSHEEPSTGEPSGASTSGDDDAPPRVRPIESGEDLFHVAIGVAVAVAMLWLLRKGIRPPGR